MRLRAIDSEIDGHPNPAEGFPFFPAATGSLGQGLVHRGGSGGGGAAGRLGQADILHHRGRREPRRAGMGGGRLPSRLRAEPPFVPIFNCNGYGQSDPVSSQQSPGVIASKLRGSGSRCRGDRRARPGGCTRTRSWNIGRRADDADARPFAIVAETVKGWGFVQAGRRRAARQAADGRRQAGRSGRTGRDGGSSWGVGDRTGTSRSARLRLRRHRLPDANRLLNLSML